MGSVTGIKHHNQKQARKERICFNFQFYITGHYPKNMAETEVGTKESMENCYYLDGPSWFDQPLCKYTLICPLGPLDQRQHPQN